MAHDAHWSKEVIAQCHVPLPHHVQLFNVVVDEPLGGGRRVHSIAVAREDLHLGVACRDLRLQRIGPRVDLVDRHQLGLVEPKEALHHTPLVAAIHLQQHPHRGHLVADEALLDPYLVGVLEPVLPALVLLLAESGVSHAPPPFSHRRCRASPVTRSCVGAPCACAPSASRACDPARPAAQGAS